eukprot:2851491-Ditylum_brightwellii.AAC.1
MKWKKQHKLHSNICMTTMNFVGLGAEDRVQQWNKNESKIELSSEFTSRKSLEECHHKYDTQLNEGINTAVVMVWGETTFWNAVFEKLGME